MVVKVGTEIIAVEHGKVANDRLRSIILDVLQEAEVDARGPSSRRHAWFDTMALTYEVAARICGAKLFTWPEDGDALLRRITSHLGRLYLAHEVTYRRLEIGEVAYDNQGVAVVSADRKKHLWATKAHADETDIANLHRVEREESRVEMAGLAAAALHDIGCYTAHPIPEGSRTERAKIVMEVEDVQRLLRLIEEGH